MSGYPRYLKTIDSRDDIPRERRDKCITALNIECRIDEELVAFTIRIAIETLGEVVTDRLDVPLS